MIGLEYILELNNVQQKDLAEELGIKKQNVTYWIKSKQKIPKKYLPILENRFKISTEYFQKELTELDKKILEKLMLDKHIEKSKFEYNDAVWNDEIKDYVTVKKIAYDNNAVENYRMVEAEMKEIDLLNKIKSVLHEINEFYIFETYLQMYEDNIKIFDRFTEVVNDNQHLDIITSVLRALELFFSDTIKQNEILEKSPFPPELVENESEIVKKLFGVLQEYYLELFKSQQELLESSNWMVENFTDED